MPKVVLSTRVSRELLERVRDYVYAFQGPPEHLTIARFAEEGLRRQVDAVKRKLELDELPRRPKGKQAGRQGRRKRDPDAKDPPRRTVLSTMVDPDLKESIWDAYYQVRDEIEFAEFAEEAIRRQLRYLRRKYGAPDQRPDSAVLRVGRRVT